MGQLAQLGNDLYTGKRTIRFVENSKKFLVISLILLLLAAIGFFVRGLNLGLEFRGGSEFRVSASATDGFESRAREAVRSVVPNQAVNVTLVGGGTVRVQTERLEDTQSSEVRSALAQEFDVSDEAVSASFVGPSWGQSVSSNALQALAWFVVLVAILMAVYFRNWKMSLAALVALAHDVFITVGIYALSGFEVSPASVIGFLTILGYSLYDNVVVFDKVRENTTMAFETGRVTFSQAANRAVNQTLIRSLNTTVTTLLPISALLIVGFFFIGPGTLLDLALALFIGIAVGAYSSIIVATPLLVWLRSKDDDVKALEKKALRHQNARAKEAAAARSHEPGHHDELDDGALVGSEPTGGQRSMDDEPAAAATLTGRAVHKYAQTGPRNQPKRAPKSKR
ncbi:protein translocase subunit SecF [Nostocoides sp. F2B08]|uniref:protein translocase subunit SecF n=1 Tax=Nostocoides sp. F2B08 TaxID=2653936 RepID=UPI001262FE06|nr:protein translocase subunit SecF [Tetrasphaera sp. F2B08]KAB7743055.1 protein translocase subunit SecF [Tetrasphaera sp. F2B08]